MQVPILMVIPALVLNPTYAKRRDIINSLLMLSAFLIVSPQNDPDDILRLIMGYFYYSDHSLGNVSVERIPLVVVDNWRLQTVKNNTVYPAP